MIFIFVFKGTYLKADESCLFVYGMCMEGRNELYSTAVNLLQEEFYVEGYEQLVHQFNSGDYGAARFIAMVANFDGFGPNDNSDEFIVRWLIKGSAKNDNEAMLILGIAYHEGRYGLKIDREKAKKLYYQSWALGNPISAYRYVGMVSSVDNYFDVEINALIKAASKLGAEKGHARSQYTFAQWYLINNKEGHQANICAWLRLSVLQGFSVNNISKSWDEEKCAAFKDKVYDEIIEKYRGEEYPDYEKLYEKQWLHYKKLRQKTRLDKTNHHNK